LPGVGQFRGAVDAFAGRSRFVEAYRNSKNWEAIPKYHLL